MQPKKIVIAFAVALAAGPRFAGSASAQAEGRIGFVNTERILRDAVPAQREQKKIEAEFAKRDQEMQKTAEQIRKLQESLEKNAVTMPETERRNKEREFSDLNKDFQRKQREFREDLNQRRNEELAAVLERANRTIKAIAESEKYDIIFQEAVYASPRIDITDKVIKALNSTASINLGPLFGTRGISLSVSGACASGAHAIGWGWMLIESGMHDLVIAGASQEVVQLEQLAAFPLPAHPDALTPVENAMAMQQQKSAVLRGRVFFVEFVDETSREFDHGVGVFIARFADGVRQIGQQGKVQIGIAIRQEAYFEVIDELVYLVLVQQH